MQKCSYCIHHTKETYTDADWKCGIQKIKMKQVNQIAILNNVFRKLLLKILHLQEVIRRTAVFNANKR